MEIKNVVIINDFDYIQGGASKVAIQTANILKEKNPNLNVYFFSGCHKDTSNLNKDVISVCMNQIENIKDKNKIKGIINDLYNFKAKRSLKKLLLTLNKDETIIHVHGWTKSLSSSVFDVAFKMKFKIILTMHDYFTACPNGGYFNYKKNEICNLKPLSFKCIKCDCDSRNYKFKLYRVLRQFIQNKIVKLNDKLEYVISISDFSEKILKNTLNNNVKIYRVSNPIDYSKNPSRVNYKNNNYFLYVGRISKEKGVDTFCEAIRLSGLEGIVVGDGSELQRLKEEYKNANIDFVGWKSSEEVKSYMKGAKALIIPSRWYEVAPLTPLEAMQLGIPVFTSDCNATIDYIDKTNGMIFKNVSELVEIMKSDFNFNVKLDEKYSNDNYYDDLIKVYNEIM